MPRYLFLCLLLPWTLLSQAQRLYMPRDVQRAFTKGTRSYDGRPGKNYWQNRARYNISITAMPPVRTIMGREQITYINNSPDTLKNLVFKLILNIHKPGAPRLGPTSEDYLTSGVHIDSFAVNGRVHPWNNNPYSYTNVFIPLREPVR